MHLEVLVFTIITRQCYVCNLKDLFHSILNLMRRVLVDAGFKITDVNEIILVGGSTRIPKIHQIVKAFFKGTVRTQHIFTFKRFCYFLR